MQSKRIFLGFPVSNTLKTTLTGFKTETLETIAGTEKVRWVSPSNYHVTLLFIGNTAVSDLSGLGVTIRDIISRHFTFRLEAAHFTTFPERSPRMFWFSFQQAEPFTQLHKELAKNILGIAPEGRVLPHITIGRFKPGKIKSRQWRPENNPVYSCKTVHLYESVFTPSGVQYSVLQSFELAQTPITKVPQSKSLNP